MKRGLSLETKPIIDLTHIKTPPTTSYEMPDADKVNNVMQKERELARAGVTRLKAYEVVRKALEAKMWKDVVDDQGNVCRELVDDVEKQKWGAEMCGKYFGDFVREKQEVEGGMRSLVVAEREAIKRRIVKIMQVTTFESVEVTARRPEVTPVVLAHEVLAHEEEE